jgi:hypothetical protein
MKVFVSYVREDEAVAHLLSYILGRNGIKCLLDRGLQPGRQFDTQIQDMIKDADMILLLLTNASAQSPWVNQEIGFAIAHGKKIWPLATGSYIEPHGMLASTQSYSMFDWSDPGRTVDRLVKTLQSSASGDLAYFREYGLEHIIKGKIERTRFVVQRLRELLQDTSRDLEIRAQAAFSIFAVSDDPRYRRQGEHTEEYMHLLLAERAAMHALATSPRCRFKLFLWPARAYEPEYLAVRFQALLKWMEEVKGVSSVEYVCAPYSGPNRIIVKDDFCVEGFKLHHQSGYQMTIVKYEREATELAAREFDIEFAQCREDKSITIEKVRSMSQHLARPWAES